MRSLLVITAILATLLASQAAAQGPGGLPPASNPSTLFTIQLEQADTVASLAPGGTVLMEAPAIGTRTTARFLITYLGRQTEDGLVATTIEEIELTGSRDFSLSGAQAPIPLEPGASFDITAIYLPTSSELKEGEIAITFQDEDRDTTFVINLNGTAPEYAYTFTPDGGNTGQVAPGEALEFPDTPLETASGATFVVTNVGTAPGTLDGISPAGAAYAVTGLPLLPTEIAPDGTLSFTISFTPEELGALAGALDISMVGGPVSFPLQGIGTGAEFTYEMVVGGQPTPVEPGQLLRLEDTLVSETSTVLIRVRNIGNVEGTISAITVSGDAYEAADLPFLPATVQPDGTVLFSLSFTPAEIGQQVGRLKIGDAEFDLVGDGVGSFLEYSAKTDGTVTPVEDNGTVIFTPAMVGGSTLVAFSVTNTGTEETTINSISLASAGGPFSITELPDLPLTLAGGSTAVVAIEYSPLVEGSDTETLVIDAATFTLSGTGTPPAPLPTYTFAGDSGAQAPASQPSIGLSLGESYALKVVGTLTLSFASDVFADDPSVQFATGGSTVDFEIPAGETSAIFPNGTDRIKVQTGTVAGTIIVTPSFATSGGADLTPETPDTQMMSVAESAPVIASAVISSKASTSITLQVTGFATSRQVSQINLQFAARAGENVSTTNLSIDAVAQFAAWYQSSQSTQYGSAFTVTIPLSFSGDVNEVSGTSDTVQSISVTLNSAQGASNSITVQNAAD